jgi:hypothetical protein
MIVPQSYISGTQATRTQTHAQGVLNEEAFVPTRSGAVNGRADHGEQPDPERVTAYVRGGEHATATAVDRADADPSPTGSAVADSDHHADGYCDRGAGHEHARAGDQYAGAQGHQDPGSEAERDYLRPEPEGDQGPTGDRQALDWGRWNVRLQRSRLEDDERPSRLVRCSQ